MGSGTKWRLLCYGESWDSSCENSCVPVQSHWVTVNLKTDFKTPYYSLLKQKYTSSIVKHNKTKKNKHRLSTATKTATEIIQTGYSTKNIFRSITRSLRERPTGCMPQIILRLCDFLCVRDTGRKDNKITALVITSPSDAFSALFSSCCCLYYPELQVKLYSRWKSA